MIRFIIATGKPVWLARNHIISIQKNPHPDAKGALIRMSKFKTALVGENGSDAATHVLITCLMVIENLDDRWVGRQLPGEPSINDYADAIIHHFRYEFPSRR